MTDPQSTLAVLDPAALWDDSEFLVRPIQPEDADALVRFHLHLSQRSVTLRYFYPHLELRAEEVAHLTQIDRTSRMALVVEREGDLIAVGRYDRLDDPSRAEVAFVVADAYQHRGIATELLRRLAELALTVGITHLTAEVMAENKAMLKVFHAAGFPTASSCQRGIVELDMAISPSPDSRPSSQTGTRQITWVPPDSAR